MRSHDTIDLQKVRSSAPGRVLHGLTGLREGDKVGYLYIDPSLPMAGIVHPYVLNENLYPVPPEPENWKQRLLRVFTNYGDAGAIKAPTESYGLIGVWVAC